MDVFRHHDISHHYEPIALAGLFQHGEGTVAAPCGTEQRHAAIARTRDKVQRIGAIVAMQSARHDEHDGISSIAAHPCKKRKDGASTFRYGKTQAHGKAGPPRPSGKCLANIAASAHALVSACSSSGKKSNRIANAILADREPLKT
jgi:hypothetical protein